MKITLTEFLCGVLVILVLLGVPGFYVGKAYFKAQSWNKLNPDRQVTIWDAMVLDLRVTE